MRDVAATRESPRIRRANEANTVNIEVETANTIIAAAVNDSVNAYFKSKAFSKLLSTVVKGQPFEGAVLQLNKKLPANKAQLKKAVADNSAGVRSIIQASLKPQLDKATKDFKLAADTAVKVMKTAVLAMGVATAELKEASTGAEAIADTPVEAKGGGQKARGKKAVQFVSLDKSSEEEALLPGTAQEKLAGVMNDNFADTLSAKVDPCFQQLNVTIISGLQQSVQLIGQRASADNVVLQKQMEVVAAGLSSLELTVTEHFGVLGGSCDKSRRELRQIAKTCADSGTGKYKRQRTANTSSSSTPAAKQKSKRAAHPPPSPPSSMSYDNWSSESSVEPPTPPPEPKKRGKPGRTPWKATSAKPLSSIYPNTASMVQLQQEIAPAFQPQQPQQGQQPQHQQSQQPQHQQILQPQHQQSQQPQHQQILQPQHQQSQQPPAPHQQQHHRMGQMGVAHPAPIGHWNNIGIPALPPQAQTAINSPPAPHSYPYLTLQG
ncbi:unnamed protein product [Laminaria digitata]